MNFPVTWKNRSRYLQRVFSDALRAKTDKLRFCLVYTSINNIILRAGTSICASSGFGPLGPKPCGGNYCAHQGALKYGRGNHRGKRADIALTMCDAPEDWHERAYFENEKKKGARNGRHIGEKFGRKALLF